MKGTVILVMMVVAKKDEEFIGQFSDYLLLKRDSTLSLVKCIHLIVVIERKIC